MAKPIDQWTKGHNDTPTDGSRLWTHGEEQTVRDAWDKQKQGGKK